MTPLLLVAHGTLATILIVVCVLAVQAKTGERVARMATILLGLTVAQTLVGDVLYTFYLRTTKPALHELAAGSRSVADAFDVKEHLAFLALVMAAGAFFATRRRPKPTALVRVLVSGAHATIVLTATIGLIVASIKTP